jgi:Na+-driven multidrug efflux pump
MVMNIIQSMFNIIDMTVLKNFGSNSDYAVGAVGACATLITLITGLLIGVSAGANVVIAKRIGRKDSDGEERAVGAALSFAFFGGLSLMLIGVLGAELFLSWTNCPE